MVRPDGKDGMGRRRSFVAREDALPASPPSCGRRGDVRGRTRTQSARHSTRVLSQDAENMLRASFSTSLQCTEDIRMSRGSRVPPSRLRSLARCAAAARNPRSNINRVKALDFTLWQEHWSSVRAALCATRTLSRMSLGNARRSIVSKNLRRLRHVCLMDFLIGALRVCGCLLRDMPSQKNAASVCKALGNELARFCACVRVLMNAC